MRAMSACSAVVLCVVGLGLLHGAGCFPMLGANLQRNGQVLTAPGIHTTPNRTWDFENMNGHQFVHSPIYAHEQGIVWTVSSDGFVYAVNATTGRMLHEVCVDGPVQWWGDPCPNTWFTNLPYGQPTLLSNGDVLVLRDRPSEPDEMYRISASDGSIVWKWSLPKQAGFLSLPTVLPNSPMANGGDAILIWVQFSAMPYPQYDPTIVGNYTVLEGKTGRLISQISYGNPVGRMYAPMTLDPADGNIMTQYFNISYSLCGRNGFDYMKCTGLGKFTPDGRALWNVSMQLDWIGGMFALDDKRGVVHLPTDDFYIFSFTTSGEPRWKLWESEATGYAFYPAVCPDGTVMFPDNHHFIKAWSPEISRPKDPLWRVTCNGACSKTMAVAGDGTVYLMEGNNVVARSCATGERLWNLYYGSGQSFSNPIALAPNGDLYANVYKPGLGGVLIKLAVTM